MLLRSIIFIKAMVYLIGNIQIEIISKGEDFLGEKFQPFLSERNSSIPTMHLKAHRRNLNTASNSSELEMVNVYSRDGKVVIERLDFSGYLDFNTFMAYVEFNAKYSLEAFLRVAYSLILPHFAGLSVHASSVIRNGKAYVFPGKSGAGKTTIAELTSNGMLLTDETSVIRGIGKTPTAYGTPFHGSLELPGNNICAPIAGVYFPVKDGKNFLKRLPPQAALWKLLPNVNLFGQCNTLMERAFHLSHKLVTSLCFYDLHFLPEPSFWSCIDGQERTD